MPWRISRSQSYWLLPSSFLNQQAHDQLGQLAYYDSKIYELLHYLLLVAVK